MPTVSILAPGVILVDCHTRVEKGGEAYLPQLEKLVKMLQPPLSLLFDTSAMDYYHPSFPMAHVGPFRAWHGKIQRIAVAHKLPSIKIAIATVALASKMTIKGFATREDAFAWIEGR